MAANWNALATCVSGVWNTKSIKWVTSPGSLTDHIMRYLCNFRGNGPYWACHVRIADQWKWCHHISLYLSINACLMPDWTVNTVTLCFNSMEWVDSNVWTLDLRYPDIVIYKHMWQIRSLCTRVCNDYGCVTDPWTTAWSYRMQVLFDHCKVCSWVSTCK